MQTRSNACNPSLNNDADSYGCYVIIMVRKRTLNQQCFGRLVFHIIIQTCSRSPKICDPAFLTFSNYEVTHCLWQYICILFTNDIGYECIPFICIVEINLLTYYRL